MKNKCINKFLTIFTFIITLFQGIITVDAVSFVPKPIKIIYNESYTNLGTDATGVKIRKAQYVDELGNTKYGYVYCVEGGAGVVYINSNYNPDTTSNYADKTTGEVNDDGIRYITKNGFWGNGNVGKGDPTDTEKKEYAITQLAIWLYYYDISLDEEKYNIDVVSRRVAGLAERVRNGKYNSDNATYEYIVTEANKLCEGAKKARLAQIACENGGSCSSESKPQLNVEVKSNELKLSEDGQFLESDLITVSLKKTSKYNVVVSDDKFSIVDENGNIKTNFKNNDKIKIRVSKAEINSNISVSLTFTATSSEKVPYQYYGGTYTNANGGESTKQRLLFGTVFNDIKLENKLDFRYSIVKHNIEFSKVDATTGKELPGAHLEIRDGNNNLIESWVSTNETHFFELLPGKYTLTETIAPEGYELSTESIEFEVKKNGSITKVVMENKPVKKEIRVEFSKVDATTGKELPGAHLEIRDSNNNLIESWVSTNETHFFELLPGKYTLTETIAPEGYELSTESIEFEVKTDGSITKVVMENKPVKKEIRVEFSKVDATTGKELPGAHLEIRDGNSNLIESWVSTNETHFFELLPGIYTLTETIAPEGYELSTESIEFEVKKNGSITKVVMENAPKKLEFDVEFSKIDVSTGKELPGAHLVLKDINENLIDAWVSTNETHYVKLLPGKYTLTETIAPEGYELSTESIEFEVKTDGSVTKIVMENKPYIEVPITDLNASSAIITLGSLLFGLGLIVVYSYVKKERVQE